MILYILKLNPLSYMNALPFRSYDTSLNIWKRETHNNMKIVVDKSFEVEIFSSDYQPYYNLPLLI